VRAGLKNAHLVMKAIDKNDVKCKRGPNTNEDINFSATIWGEMLLDPIPFGTSVREEENILGDNFASLFPIYEWLVHESKLRNWFEGIDKFTAKFNQDYEKELIKIPNNDELYARLGFPGAVRSSDGVL
jgi:hypothetical protein